MERLLQGIVVGVVQVLLRRILDRWLDKPYKKTILFSENEKRMESD